MKTQCDAEFVDDDISDNTMIASSIHKSYDSDIE